MVTRGGSMSENLESAFKDESEKTLVLLIVILSIIAGFITPLVLWVIKKSELSEYAQNFIKNLLNFELTLLCVCVLFLIPFIGPILGTLGGPIVWIINVIYCIMAAMAITNSKDISLPSYKFIK